LFIQCITGQMNETTFFRLKSLLGFRESGFYSQNGEDGVLQFLLRVEIIQSRNGTCVEFGVEDGSERNTRYLAENNNYTGLLMDGSYENPLINLKKEWIYSTNIGSLFLKYNVPNNFDVLSIDLDSFDYFVWKNISNKYKPAVVITEINSFFPPPIAITQKNGFHNKETHDIHFGMSLAAAYLLAREKGYSLFYVEEMGVNAFWVRDDMAKKLLNMGWPMNDIKLLYTPCGYGTGPRYQVNNIYVGQCHPVDNERIHLYGSWVNVINGFDWLPDFVPGFVQNFKYP